MDSDTDTLLINHEKRLLALERAVSSGVMDLIYRDPHQWSTRPCGTCSQITSFIGQPFGCDRFRAEKSTPKR